MMRKILIHGLRVFLGPTLHILVLNMVARLHMLTIMHQMQASTMTVAHFQ